MRMRQSFALVRAIVYSEGMTTTLFAHDLEPDLGPYEGVYAGNGEFLVTRAVLDQIAADFNMTVTPQADGSLIVTLDPEDFDTAYRTDFDFLVEPQEGEDGPLYSVEFDGYTWVEVEH